MRSPITREACGSINELEPLATKDITVVHREEDGKTLAWDDVTGSELDPKLVLKARTEEMEQFKKHGVYEK